MVEPTRRHFVIAPERSGLVIEARSNAGPITFATSSVTGTIEAAVEDGRVLADPPPIGRVEVRIDTLASQNSLYDAEVRRRLSTRRFPRATVELAHTEPAGAPHRYEVRGPITVRGMTRELAGTVEVSIPSPDRIVVAGEHVLDMRDFDIPAPGMLMLRIFPDVRVLLHLEGDEAHGG